MSVATSTQTLAPPAPAPALNVTRDLALDRIEPSKTNPRKNFSGPEMGELVESVRIHGVLMPILVRALPPVNNNIPQEIWTRYEIVAGERRWRAAREAKLKEIPVRVVQLTDEQALEVQIVENLQRKDVTPLEEATGYAQLFAAMQKERPKEERQALIGEIATKIGKSVRYVYARMKLVELAEPVKKALASGAIAASHADELVRLQPAEQEKAFEFLGFENEYGRKKKRESAPSIRAFKEFLKEETYVDLSKAPFKLDDAKLIVEAGACINCPKLAANNPLFEKKEASATTCTDPACYSAKRVALVQIELGNLKTKGGVQPILISRDYVHDKKDRERGVLYAGEYEDHGHAGGKYGLVKEGDCKDTKLALVIGGKRRRDREEEAEVGKTLWVCTNRNECKVHSYRNAASASSGDGAAAQRAKQRIQKIYRARLFKAIAEKLKKPKREDLELIALEYFGRLGHYVETPLIREMGWDAKVGQWDGKPALKRMIASWADDALLAHLVMFSIAADLNVAGDPGKPEDLVAVAGRHGVDHAAILEQVKEEKKPKAKKAAAVKAQTSAKKPIKIAARKPKAAKPGAKPSTPKKAQAKGKKGGRK